MTVIVCSSEGWFINSDAIRSMLDYGAHELLVKPLDYNYFREFVHEYFRLKSIELDTSLDRLYSDLVGGVPGVFISLVEVGVDEWIRRKRLEFLRIIHYIVDKYGYNRDEVLEFISKLPTKLSLKKLDYRLYRLSEILLEKNIVHHTISDEEIAVDTQLPVYKTLSIELLS